jgi:hypothetical protein
MAVTTTETQRVDLDRIRKFFQQLEDEELTGILTEAQAIRPMVNELCDLAENTGLLQAASMVRLDMAYQDAKTDDPSSTLMLNDIQKLDPDNPEDREGILPSIY